MTHHELGGRNAGEAGGILAVKRLLLKPQGQRTAVASLGVDSFSVHFNHRSLQKPAVSLGFLHGFLKRRIPGKNREATPRASMCWTSW